MLLSCVRRRLAAGAAAAAATAGAAVLTSARAEPAPASDAFTALTVAELKRLRGQQLPVGEADVEVCNWSMTHSTTAKRYFQPESPEEVQRLLELMHKAGQRVRVVGSALSPNGIGLSDQGMLNMAQCDRVLSVDAKAQQATVQAGARIKDVVEALRPHGLTLQNYASIAEQQIGGFLQVGAHGTGAGVPPVDEQVIGFTLHTPASGALHLTAESHPRLFWLAKASCCPPAPDTPPTHTQHKVCRGAGAFGCSLLPACTDLPVLCDPS